MPSLSRQAHEAGERARAMERALDRLTSEKRTEEERRRELEAQLVQLVRRESSGPTPAEQTPTEAESSADEVLDPQLCRRLRQLVNKLHTEGLQVRTAAPLPLLFTEWSGVNAAFMAVLAWHASKGGTA